MPSESDFRNALRRRQTKALDIVDATVQRKEFEDWEAQVRKWREEFEKLLLDAHTTAAKLGRNRAGNFRNAPRKDEKLAKAAVKADRPFLDKFEQDLLDLRYGQSNSFDTAAVDRRMFMYLDKARATATDAFGSNSKPGKWERIMMAAEHCSTCPGKARTYDSWEELKAAGLPADGSDACVTNCECIVVRLEDGRVGFGSVFEAKKPALAEDGTAADGFYLPPAKVRHFLTLKTENDKSGLVKLAGFSLENQREFVNALREFGSKYKLRALEPGKRVKRYESIGELVGPNGEKLRIAVKWNEDGRRGLKLSTIVLPKRKQIADYEAFLSQSS